MSTAFAVPLCATCGQASTAGCPGCGLRQAAGEPPYPVAQETPARLNGRIIDGLWALVPVLMDTATQGYDISIRLPLRSSAPAICGCGRVQERSGAPTCNYCDGQGRGR